MNEQFATPHFLGEHTPPQEERSFNPGSITTVRTLDTLPANITERVPELEDSDTGYVIKQYNKKFDPNFSSHDLTLFPTHSQSLSTTYAQEFTLVDKAAILKKRQDELRRYVGEQAGDLIVPSYFFIAKGDDQTVSLYEIQKRLPEYASLHTFNIHTFQGADKHTQKNLLKEMEELKNILLRLLKEKQDPTFKTFIPDFHPENIAITNEGAVRIFDTNFWGFQWSGFVPSKVDESVRILENHIHTLSLALAEE